MAVGEPGHGGHIERFGADTAASLKEEPRGAGAFLIMGWRDSGLKSAAAKSGRDEGAEALDVGESAGQEYGHLIMLFLPVRGGNCRKNNISA